MRVTHASLFSGIGGFDLAAEWMGWENVFQVEIDPFCNKVLEKNFPNAKRYGDIKQFDGKPYRGTIDVLTGGFPCQKYSIAGDQFGNEPLKEECIRVFLEIMPTIGIIENVTQFTSDKFAHEHLQLCESLENSGYEVITFDIDAASCGLPTLERHIWIIAQARSKRSQGSLKQEVQGQRKVSWELSGSYTGEFGRWSISESRVCGVGQRIPNRVDRNKSLGNAVPPKVVYEIFKAMAEQWG